MNPFLEKMKELEPKYLYIILAGIIGIVALLDFALVMRLQFGLIASLDKSITQLNTNISELAVNNQRLGQFNGQLELARRALKNLEAMVYRKDEVPVVLKDISGIANDCGVIIDQVVPQGLSVKPLVENGGIKYYTMNISLSLRCGYHRLGKFLNQMEQRRLFWQIEELVIIADAKDPLRESVKMNFKILVLEK